MKTQFCFACLVVAFAAYFGWVFLAIIALAPMVLIVLLMTFILAALVINFNERRKEKARDLLKKST